MGVPGIHQIEHNRVESGLLIGLPRLLRNRNDLVSTGGATGQGEIIDLPRPCNVRNPSEGLCPVGRKILVRVQRDVFLKILDSVDRLKSESLPPFGLFGMANKLHKSPVLKTGWVHEPSVHPFSAAFCELQDDGAYNPHGYQYPISLRKSSEAAFSSSGFSMFGA